MAAVLTRYFPLSVTLLLQFLSSGFGNTNSVHTRYSYILEVGYFILLYIVLERVCLLLALEDLKVLWQYYYEPGTGQKFRSLREVERHLKAEECERDHHHKVSLKLASSPVQV